ncbi:tripartite tricarboxylate transporter TctB family protein [Priestia flexa]|uniref:tripartite tricarboxylate transporter TctB family protein n=1 Tax=Priestia flexa TaxID=86664 RepID=UPI001A8CBDCB|nr:tripartite tricarboxylate transporter TctB family protein [Priestia flexa]MBN8433490.1 tripartite tricarboxylate transporter TctB family protein [Priestia flexa]MCA0966251.1 tripartite tricarboxylate transporter TctB family protein [Priestia flexa]
MKWSVNKGLGLALMTLSVVYLFLAFNLPEYAFVPVDSDLIPKMLGFGLFVLAIVLFFSPDSDTEEQKKKRVIKRNELFMLLGVMALILAYITVLEVVGFVIMTTAFIIFCSRFLGYKNWVRNILTACIFSIGSYVLFNYGLAIRLPAGILPF